MKNRINTNWAKPVQKQAQAISLALMLAIVFTGSAAIADTTTKETEDDLQPSSGAQAEAQELVPPPDTTKEIVPEAKPAEPAELEDKGKASKQKPKKEKKSKSKSKKKSSEGTEKDTSDRADSAEKAVPKAPDNITESQPEAAPEVSGDSEDQSSESSNQDESGTTSSQGESSDSETTSTANDAEPEEKPKKKAKKPEHISQADKLLLSNDLEAAEEAYRALVEDDETGDAYAGLAVSLAKQKWPKKVLEAERIIRKGKQEFPDNPNMMAAAGFVSLEHSKTVSSPANRDLYIEAAEKLSKMAIAENPEIVIAHQTLGLAKLAQDDAEGAVKPFRTAARLAEDPINLTYWAEALLKINKKDTKAPQIIDEAIGEDPNYFPARLQKAIILTSQGKHEEAFTELHSIPRDERGSDWQNVQGDIYRKQGDGVSALASWKEANRLNPRNPEPYQRLGEYYTLRGDGELAIGEWHNALDILPNDMKLRSQMAELALRLDKLEVAEEEYRTILNVKPDDPKALLGLSRVFFRKARREGGQYPPGFEQLMQQLESVLAEQSVTGQVVKGAANLRENIQLSEAEKALTQKRFREADLLFNQVLEKHKEDPYDLLTLAEQAYNDGALKTAERAFSFAREIPEVAPRADQGLSKIISQRNEARRHTELGDATWKLPKVAIDHYKQALIHDPQHPPAYYGLFSLLCKKKEDPEEAMDYGNSFLESSDDSDPKRKEVEENLSKLKKRVDKENSK